MILFPVNVTISADDLRQAPQLATEDEYMDKYA